MAFDPATAALEIGSKLLDHFFPDPAQKQAAALQLLQLQQNGELAQLTADTELAKAQAQIDQAEAASGNAFVGGWRPLIGYICGAVLANHFIIAPFVVWANAAFFGHQKIDFPDPAMGDLWTVLLGMLGLGAMRTYEKVKGVAS